MLALRQQLLQLIQKVPLVMHIAEAARCSLVTGRADGIRQHQQRIIVAIRRDAYHIQEMARGFAFGPQTLFSA